MYIKNWSRKREINVLAIIIVFYFYLLTFIIPYVLAAIMAAEFLVYRYETETVTIALLRSRMITEDIMASLLFIVTTAISSTITFPTTR